MGKMIKYVGLDVHKDSIAISIANEGRDGALRYYGTILNDMKPLDKILRTIISQKAAHLCVYEAGPCGYHIYRHLSENGIDCSVVAPALISKKSGDRIKTDRRDSQALARLHRAGDLTAVYVPDAEDEALRDIVRAIDDAQPSERQSNNWAHSFSGITVFIREKANGRDPILTGWRISPCHIRLNKLPFKNILMPLKPAMNESIG